MAELPKAYQLTTEFEIGDQPLRIRLEIEGSGKAAQMAIAHLSAAVAALAAERDPQPVGRASATPAAKPAAITSDVPANAALPSSAASSTSASLKEWAKERRATISATAGVLALALAAFAILVAPPDQRSAMLPMLIVLILGGAALLASAAATSPKADEASNLSRQATSLQPQRPLLLSSEERRRRRAMLLSRERSGSAFKSTVGLMLGLLFAVAGLVAPFLLGATSADERFLLMIGFAPVSVVGFFMLAIFGRRLSEGISPTRDGSAAMPLGSAYRLVLPIAIISLLTLTLLVVGLVILGNLLAIAR